MIPVFKIRCHAIGAICGGILNKPTYKQLATLDLLQSKPKRTEIQEQTLLDLIAKRDAPPALQDGAKTYCENWLRGHIYGVSKEFSNKYTEKGQFCEPAAIELVADVMNYGLISKNEASREDDDFTGTCDLDLSDIIEDIKNSWSVYTFPCFDKGLKNSDYFLQLQGYMALYNKNKAAVNYCLIDAPDEIVNREALLISRKAGFDDIDMELYDEVKAKMTFSHHPKERRVKRFEFYRDDSIIAAIRRQVGLCRIYIDELIKDNPILIS